MELSCEVFNFSLSMCHSLLYSLLGSLWVTWKYLDKNKFFLTLINKMLKIYAFYSFRATLVLIKLILDVFEQLRSNRSPFFRYYILSSIEFLAGFVWETLFFRWPQKENPMTWGQVISMTIYSDLFDPSIYSEILFFQYEYSLTETVKCGSYPPSWNNAWK